MLRFILRPFRNIIKNYADDQRRYLLYLQSHNLMSDLLNIERNKDRGTVEQSFDRINFVRVRINELEQAYNKKDLTRLERIKQELSDRLEYETMLKLSSNL